MRWVVLTPTFAAGLVVVVAAAMSAPTHTVDLLTKPFRGQPCATPGCVSGKGSPASRPGSKRLVIPARVPASHMAGGQLPAVGGAGHNVLVQYRTLGQGRNGDFNGQLILASRTAQPLSNWVLQFSYPGQIRVWAGQSQQSGQHSVTVTSGQYGGGWAGWSGGRIVQIVFSVSGQAGPPATCTVDGQPCNYRKTLPGQGAGGGGYGGGYGSGGGYGGGSYGGGSYGAGGYGG